MSGIQVVDVERLSRGLAGAPGFEPGNGGTKNRCLTTWRRPKTAVVYGGAVGRAIGRVRASEARRRVCRGGGPTLTPLARSVTRPFRSGPQQARPLAGFFMCGAHG